MLFMRHSLFRAPVRPLLPALAAACLLSAPAVANDTAANIGAGGLVLSTTESVSMDREDLYISPSAVRVDYVFTNRSKNSFETIIAFPMPDIVFRYEEYVPVPKPQSDNFMDFKVEQDGAPITAELEQRATASGLDVTADLKAAGVPLQALRDDTIKAINALPPGTQADWTARGILEATPADGAGNFGYEPVWTLHTTYWWRTVFPAGRSVKVHHSYRPSVGGTVDTAFLQDDKPSESYPDYAKRYCVNDGFVKKVGQTRQALKDTAVLMEKWISYILMTANNWHGPIGTFHLTVDKEDPNALVSFCATGSKKTGPTTFEMTQKDYFPQRDLDVLIVYPQKTE